MLAFLALVPEMAMASASQFLAVCTTWRSSSRRTIRWPLPGGYGGRHPAVVVSAAVVADNRVADNPAEIPDSSRPTSTDYRNTDEPPQYTIALPNSYASRNIPIRNSSY